MTAKRPLTPKEDLAESKRRAKAARAPIAKAATKRVVEAKERAYSGQAAREASAQMRRDARSVAPKRVPHGSTKTKAGKRSRS